MRTVRALGEVGLIAREAQKLRRNTSVRIGIGDDAAVLRGPGGQLLLFASDMMVEGVHFKRQQVPAMWIGWKALACNISDVAAMGGIPRWAVVSLGLPPTIPVRFVDELYAGLERCARRFRLAIVGGDTVRAPQVIVDVAILGTVRPARLTLRSGAQVGDALFVTGRLGGSYASGWHARFIPRVREAQELGRRVRIHAMMDLSDGLVSDLWQMSRSSRVRLCVEASRVPVSRAARTCLRRTCACQGWRGRQALHHALMDGEDFELLFAVAPRDAQRVPSRIGSTPVTRIGRVVARGIGVELEAHGRTEPLVHRGFRHF